MSWTRFHALATGLWLILIIPTVIWWKDSILWIGVMSVYANASGHWAAYQGARAEGKNDGS